MFVVVLCAYCYVVCFLVLRRGVAFDVAVVCCHGFVLCKLLVYVVIVCLFCLFSGFLFYAAARPLMVQFSCFLRCLFCASCYCMCLINVIRYVLFRVLVLRRGAAFDGAAPRVEEG